ncbi:MAG: TonB-dependent receptor [Bacteroidia bacterium]|nr:TonB-dependent receptor [Bacteroidia bacterium]
MTFRFTFFPAVIALFFFAFFSPLYAQHTIRGVVLDESSNESVIGATVNIKDQPVGTVTDYEGLFSLTTDLNFPLTLEVSSFDFITTYLIVEAETELLSVTLRPENTFSDEVVVSASRIEEKILESPVSIEKFTLMKIRETPGSDVFASMAGFKGIQINTSSLTFTSINTRGFADAQNWRFIQYVDGMDINSPGLNYSFGNLLGPTELDLRNIEVVPGPGSALYGPNAFNGLLVMNSKNPFEYQGISAQVKGGITVQKAAGNNPFGEFTLRYGKMINERWAFKFNVNYLTATDWGANDESWHITQQNVAQKDPLLQRPRSHPNFNAVNVYGDEIVVPVYITPDSAIQVNRSGIAESEILDYGVNNFKLNGSLHFRPQKNVEAVYDVRFFQADAILRHTTVYPMRDIRQLIQKLEVKGEDFNVKAYYSYEDANKSYALLGTGAFIQEGLKSSARWSGDYGAAYRGEVPGISAGDHAAARLFADRDIPGSESENFQKLRNASLSNPDVLTGGSRFIDKSSMLHVEANYDFRGKIAFFDLQEGISYRQYFLNSEGNLFNDGELGFNGIIAVQEYGAYAQASKNLLNDHLAFRSSLRIDKNQNFEARVSPRASAVVSLGKERQHNFRLSGQTGFRNPATQETYIALDIGSAIILGGTQDNINHYNYNLGENKIVNGRDIHQQFVTTASVAKFLAEGANNPSLLVPSRLDYLRQEQITTFELGYRGLWKQKLLIDANVYYNTYQDFVTRTLAYSLLVNRAFAVYTNVPDKITSYGAGLQLEYIFPRGYRVWGNYTYTTFDAEEAMKNNPGFFPAFNTPQNRFNLNVSNRDVFKGIGFSAAFRWSDSYLWQSPFGQGEIPAYNVVDAAVSYRITAVKSTLKIGAANLLNQEYKQIYGGPAIGAQYYMSFTFDELLN